MLRRFLSALLVCTPPLTAAPQLTDPPPLYPVQISDAPKMDGRLDDPVWQSAPATTGFRTFTPEYGKSLPGKTTVFLAYDRENMYFAFKCDDPEPGKIKTSVTRRDNIRPDDWVCINLDSFNDQQALYAFYINPDGIQGDSRYANGREDLGVDLIWYSAGARNEEGYTIEVQIPFKSISFASGDTVRMGVIFERRFSRTSEQGTWPALDPDKGTFFLTQMKPLEFHNVTKPRLFELLPAVTASRNSSDVRGRLESQGTDQDLSLTTKLGLSSDIVLDGTFNPDFSQVEADVAQVDVNLRFALFFPETRPFFLEGSEKFNVSGRQGGDPLRAVVHTRTIANPIGGLKLSGKFGKKNSFASIDAFDEISEGRRPPNGDKYAHATILRYRRALGGDDFVGMFYTGRNLGGGFNRVFGPDGQIRISQASVLGFHGLLSRTRAPEADQVASGHAVGLDYLYNTSRLSVLIGAQDLDGDFETRSGFVTRTGISRLRTSITPKFYPSSSWLRRLSPSLSSAQTHDKPSDKWETENALSLGFVFHGSARASVGYVRSNEIFRGALFTTDGFTASASSQLNNSVFASLFYRRGDAIRFANPPAQAYGSSISAQVILQPTGKLDFDFRLSYADLFNKENDSKFFDITILRSRTTYQANRYLFFRAILEYNAFAETLLSDFLASFTYIPGTVLHFGYGSFYERNRFENQVYVEDDALRETRRGIFFKTSYLWRM